MPSLKCSGFACSVRYSSQTAGWWPPELVCLQKVWPQTMSLARQQTLSLLMLCLGWAAEGQHWAWLVPAWLSGSKYSFSTTVSTLFCWSHDIRQFSLVSCMAFTWSEMALSMKTTCSIKHEPFKTVPTQSLHLYRIVLMILKGTPLIPEEKGEFQAAVNPSIYSGDLPAWYPGATVSRKLWESQLLSYSIWNLCITLLTWPKPGTRKGMHLGKNYIHTC